MAVKDSAQVHKKDVQVSTRSKDLGDENELEQREEPAKPLLPGSKQFKHVISGGVAGAVSRTCVSPLERVKILLQVSPNQKLELREHERFLI